MLRSLFSPLMEPAVRHGVANRRSGGGIPSLSSWFSDGGDGQLCDFTKTDRFFQESTGPTLADDVGEAIGLALDSHGWGGQTLAQVLAAQTAAISSQLNAAQWTFTNASGAASRTATVLHLESATDRIVAKHDSAVSHVVGKMLRVTIQVSGTGTIRLFGVSGNGGTTLLYSITLSGAPTNYVVYFSNPTAGTDFGVGIYGGASTSGASPADVTFALVDIKLLPGTHGLQATGTLKGARQTTGIRFDGTDDNLLTGYLAQSSENSIIALVTVPASLAATQAIVGASGLSANRAFLAINTSGFLCGGVGSDSTSTIIGTTDLRGTEVVVGLSMDGTTVKLFAGSAQEYSAAQGSTPTTAIPYRIGSYNNNGTAASFFGGSIKKLFVDRKAKTLAQYLQIRAAMLAS